MVVRGGCIVNALSFKERVNVLLHHAKQLHSHRSIHGSWCTSRGLLPWESLWRCLQDIYQGGIESKLNQVESNMLGFTSRSLQYSCLKMHGCLCKLSNSMKPGDTDFLWFPFLIVYCSKPDMSGGNWSCLKVSRHFIALLLLVDRPGTQQLCWICKM